MEPLVGPSLVLAERPLVVLLVPMMLRCRSGDDIMLLLLLWPSLVALVTLVVLLVLLVPLMLSLSVRPSLMLAAFPLLLLVLMPHSFQTSPRWCWQGLRC